MVGADVMTEADSCVRSASRPGVSQRTLVDYDLRPGSCRGGDNRVSSGTREDRGRGVHALVLTINTKITLRRRRRTDLPLTRGSGPGRRGVPRQRAGGGGFFEAGESRMVAWARRPQAAEVVAALADSDRGWDAIVVGSMSEPFTAASTAWSCRPHLASAVRLGLKWPGLAGSLAGCWSGPVVDEDCAERADQQVAFCLLDPVGEGVDGVAG